MTLGSSSKRVMMVLESHYPTAGGGGAEGQLRTISRYLANNGVDVQVIVPMREDGPQTERDAVDGLPVWRIPFPKLRKIGGLILLVRLAWGLYRRRHDYHVVHAHIAHNMAAVSAIVGRALGKTVVVKITGSRELSGGVLDASRRNLAVAVKRWALRRVTYFQATSRRIRDRLVENGFDQERVRIIPNAVDVGRFSVDRQERASRQGPLTGIYIGRLEHAKGVDSLIAAWVQAIPAGTPNKLMIIGDGSQRERLEGDVEQSGRSGQIAFLGPQEDVQRFLRQADFSVLPSRYEGLSNALLEAMAARLPVLGTRVSGTEDFLDDEQCGWLVEADDVDALAGGLRRVVASGRAELQEKGEAAYQRVVGRARIEAVAAQLANLYEIDSAHFKNIRRSQYI